MFVRTASAEFFSQILNLHRTVTILFAAIFLVAASLGQASANSRYAAYVMDAKTGKVLFSSNADSRRYPASLTKMMTLYLLFEGMKEGRYKSSSRIPVSARAAAEPPTKLGVKAGGSITVEHAIKALITRSANDISTAVAEFVGGSEQAFARMMTAKARQLGMTNTQYRNAHGLPNTEQYTTARDQAILGIALREHFPQYYTYFSTRSFKFGKQTINSHNRLLGKLQGTDGIKTGYTRASGFNIVTSVQRDGRSVVAVVMGGKSAASRDQHVAALIRDHFPQASRRGGGNLVSAPRPAPRAQEVAAASIALPRRDIPVPSLRPDGEVDMQVAAYIQTQTPPAVAAAAAAMPSRVTPPAAVPVPTASPASDDRFAVDSMSTASIQTSGWAVQIASSTSQKEALAALVRAGKNASGIVSDANAFIEEFNNKGTLYYRARFGFSSKNQAVNACSALKKQKIDCFTSAL
ncbi:serine hydrolase [Aquamicrobium sp. cd-1]|uniref:Serine hydrolase n=2 Tax=Aquamicrobium zhengzhouense TaxID=2781738 RepID=A0ABS0S7Z3_9HYPH|nr:serine hydrolase [Aquamicrobium zhengzhouense]